ncbi:hypothetical protein G6011_11024 [Alternaria panax]|uniref:Uncharacterized protein n=1 Tax=Alternaria panax TaxID=48097 RepID=A0AAD4ICW1_9PLEO|nr:hypothetical protein G6011_11024 [Alternaria panax]
MFIATIKLFSFLINPEFWTRTGFFIGYVLAFLLVLEVVRLASTDANRKEVEKLLDAYAASRNDVPVRSCLEEIEAKKVVQVSIDELEDMEKRSVAAEMERTQQLRKHGEQRERTRTPSPAVARTSESKHVEEKRRRRATSTSVSPHNTSQSHTRLQTSSSSPTRRLRKRSDTLNSSSSAEDKDATCESDAEIEKQRGEDLGWLIGKDAQK